MDIAGVETMPAAGEAYSRQIGDTGVVSLFSAFAMAVEAETFSVIAALGSVQLGVKLGEPERLAPVIHEDLFSIHCIEGARPRTMSKQPSPGCPSPTMINPSSARVMPP
jgi:hypothetical protein